MKIEILYFDGCPNHRPTVERVKKALQQEGLTADIAETNVGDDATAQAVGFLGSPSVRIDGLDIEPSVRSSKAFGMMCRTYAEEGRQVGPPPVELLRAALRESAALQPAAHEGCTAPTVSPQLAGSAGPKRETWLLGSSVAAAIVASLCCLLPIVAAATGLGTLAAGAAFEKWRPYLLGATGLLLGAGIVLAYRNYKKACAPGSLCATKPMGRRNFIALGTVAVLVAGLAAFPHYSGAVAEAVIGTSTPSINVGSAAFVRVTFRIPDMDCPACAVALTASLHKVQGVADAKLDVDGRKAVVTYDSTTQDVAVIQKVISDAGFHVASLSRF
jgi:copper chaperone CopZ